MTTLAPTFVPTARQRQVWDTVRAAPRGSLSLIGYGGAAGGGKTRAEAEFALDYALTYPGVRVLVARRDLVDLRSTTLLSFDENAPSALISRRTDSPMVTRYVRLDSWPAGVTSRIDFRELKDWLSIASEEYGAAILEEAGEIPRDAALMILSRMRHPAAKKRVVFAASNPWPGWFEDWFVKREIDEKVLEAAGGRITFIPAFISDNPHLPDNYEALLRAMYPDDWVARLVEGRFGGYKGQVYSELGPHLQWVGALPDFARLPGGLDFGGANPEAHKTAGVVSGITASNKLVRFAHFEHAGSTVHADLWTWMRGVEARMKRRVMWRADKTQSWGISLAREAGFQIEPSHGGADSVWAGIGLVNRRFHDATSYYTIDLTRTPVLDGRTLNGKSWYDRMTAYRWQEQPDPDKAVPGSPIKRDDDTPDADRYMHEEADGFPILPKKHIQTISGRKPASRAV